MSCRPVHAAVVLLCAWITSGCSPSRSSSPEPEAQRPDGDAPERAPGPHPDAPPAVAQPSQPASEPDAAEQAEPQSPLGSDIPAAKVVLDEQTGPAMASFVRAMPNAGCVWAGPLAGNGGRDVLVFVPPEADPAAQLQLVYHFHGTYSEHLQERRPGLKKRKWVGWNRLQQTLEAAAQLQNERPHNVALVYPLSAGKRPEPEVTGWWNRAYDRMWMHPTDLPEYSDSFETLHQEVLDRLGEHCGVDPRAPRPKVIAEGHSAGGIALLNIAQAGTKRVGEYIFQDAGFQDWADGTFAAVRSHDAGALVTLVITDGGIADPFGKRDPWCTELEQGAAAFEQHRRLCERDPEATPAGRDETCAQLREASQAWPDYRTWCEGMKRDMVDVPGVYVHRTSVYHGDQPRRFTGGLELPPDRFAEDRREASSVGSRPIDSGDVEGRPEAAGPAGQ